MGNSVESEEKTKNSTAGNLIGSYTTYLFSKELKENHFYSLFPNYYYYEKLNKEKVIEKADSLISQFKVEKSKETLEKLAIEFDPKNEGIDKGSFTLLILELLKKEIIEGKIIMFVLLNSSILQLTDQFDIIKIQSEAIEKCKEKKIIVDLKNAKLDQRSCFKIIPLIKENCQMIEKIVLSGNRWKDSVSELLLVLKESKIKEINLSRNSLGHADAKAIANFLKENKSLVALDISNNDIKEEGIKEIGEALLENPLNSLKVLDISENTINGLPYALIPFIENSNNLTEISACVCEKGYYKNLKIKEFSDVLQKNTCLTSLRLNGNEIGEEIAHTLAEVLLTNTTLRKLELNGNQIGDSGVKFLCEYLKVNKTLRSLSIASNVIGDVGTRILFETLQENSNLKEIDFSGNWIGKKSSIIISEFLETNTSLQILDISSSKFLEEHANKIIESLKTNSTLKKLGIRCRQIGSNKLAEMIKINKGLTELDIRSNQFEKEDGKFILESLKQNWFLEELRFDRYFFGEEISKQIEQKLEINSIKLKLTMLLIYSTKETILSKLPRRLLTYLLSFC